ncbi:hypothetical protein CsSME_00039441 [Camellia sinensis var. sinensis]
MLQLREVGGLVPLGPLLKQFPSPQIKPRAMLSCLSKGTLKSSDSSLFRNSQGRGIKKGVPTCAQPKENNDFFKG